jgi:EAL domain-containing protein (putative c-di-GMP-specific phosphodiesterase class I)
MDAAERVPVAGPSYLGLDATWVAAIERVLNDPSEHRLVFQPIVDLTRGTVVGYEALSRFSGPPVAPPNEWFNAAARAGLGSALEAVVLDRALRSRASLPRNTFLSLNASPSAILDADVFEVFESHRDLSRTVIELTEHDMVNDYADLRAGIDRLRNAGAFLAVDDAGAGYASLSHILSLRPQFVKLDRALVGDVDHDEAKAAVIEMFGTFAGRIDAWLLAEGVERPEELDALIRLRVPLAQGFYFGRPANDCVDLEPEHVERIVRRVEARRQDLAVASLLEQWPAVRSNAAPDAVRAVFDRHRRGDVLAVTDVWERPVALTTREAVSEGRIESLPVLVVKVTSPIGEVARRAMTRPVEQRFDPIACIDDSGCYAGMLPIERFIEHLAR